MLCSCMDKMHGVVAVAGAPAGAGGVFVGENICPPIGYIEKGLLRTRAMRYVALTSCVSFHGLYECDCEVELADRCADLFCLLCRVVL